MMISVTTCMFLLEEKSENRLGIEAHTLKIIAGSHAEKRAKGKLSTALKSTTLDL